jgi:hypothetical protein
MMRFQNYENRRAIENAQEGTNLHNLISLVAFKLYQSNPQNPSDKNWNSAKSKLENWSREVWFHGLPLSYLDKYLSERALDLSRVSYKSEIENWNTAMNMTANQILQFMDRKVR